MNVEVFALCDAATEWMGKLNIVGIFDAIHARRLPVVHRHCALAVRLRLLRIEGGEHALRINIIDADGTQIVPTLGGTLRAVFPEEGPSHAFNFIVNLEQLTLQETGEYAVDLSVDGRPAASTPLFVRLAPGEAPPRSR